MHLNNFDELLTTVIDESQGILTRVHREFLNVQTIFSACQV
jgi:hypothetical protein